VHRDAIPVDERGPVEEIGHRQRNPHATPDLSPSDATSGATLLDRPRRPSQK
jgi:hypothetical protein